MANNYVGLPEGAQVLPARNRQSDLAKEWDQATPVSLQDEWDQAKPIYAGLPEGAQIISHPKNAGTPFNANETVDGVPKWGRDNPNLYAGAMTTLDLLPMVANLAKSTGVGIPLAGAINTGAKYLQRQIAGEPTTGSDMALDFLKGATIEGAGRGINAAIKGVTNIPAFSAGMRKASDKLTEMAFKQPTTLKPQVRANNLTTAHEGGFLPNPTGVQQLNTAILDAENTLADGIAAGQAANVRGTFDQAIMNLEGLRPRALRSSDPAGNSRLIDAEIDRLVNHPLADTSGTVDIGTLQKMKVEQGRAIQKSYGQEKSDFANLIDKARVRGLKEELENKLSTDFPKLAATNSHLSDLYSLKKVLERASNRIENNQGIGIGFPIKSGTGAAIGGMIGGPTGAAIGGGLGTIAGIIEHPTVSPRVGQVLYRAAKVGTRAPRATNAIKRTGDVIGPALDQAMKAALYTAEGPRQARIYPDNDPLGIR